MSQETLTEKIGKVLYNEVLWGARPVDEEEHRGKEPVENLLEKDIESYRSQMEDVYDVGKKIKKTLGFEVFDTPVAKVVDREEGEKERMDLESLVDYIDTFPENSTTNIETWKVQGPCYDDTIREIEVRDMENGKEVHIKYRTLTEPAV